MSNIYIQEPPSNGKVLLKTTLGDIDIELWSKEAPKACRNFVQLCLENYYDNVIFHRVVKGFIAQGGDPTGTGTGGESVYGKPFKDEFHQRLKFNRRGLVAMANAGKDDNGSQFFFTLDRTEELNKKHTIFGKVAGHTIYNMVRFNDLEVDEDDRPISPPKILRTEVLYNPFDDIVPRKTKSTVDKNETEKSKIKSKSKATKNFTLLSFGEEAEEDEVENDHLIQEHKVKSSHDVLDDPRLSSQTVEEAVVENPSQKKTLEEDNIHAIRKKLKNEDKKSNQSKDRKDIDDTTIDKKKLSKEKSEKLIKNNTKKEKTENSIEEDNKAKNELMEELVNQRKEYLKEKKDKKILKKERGGDREKMTLKLLAGFQNQLDSFKDEEQAESKTEKQWMSHQLNFEDGEESAKDANMKSDDWYDIYDPRNPVNKRRRDASKGESKKKKR